MSNLTPVCSRSRSRVFSALLLLCTFEFGQSQTVQHGLRVPAGFEVTEFAGSDLANDIYTLTIDPKGRVIVAGRGYIRVLVDRDGDGKADFAIEYANEPKDGAMGLFCEGDTLWCSGDGGLRRFRTGADGKAAGPSVLILKMKTGGEHAAHAIRRGPDGWLYLLGGNNTGIDQSYAKSSTSPIQKPVAGCVLRMSPDLKTTEIVADGFRNPYDMDFNADGELFTYDSDNERCVGLPWYEFTRFYHVLPGTHHGWLNPQHAEWWRLPPYFPDVAKPVATTGRGSPTACICYRHGQFPVKYRGGFFLFDWTFGRIWFAPLKREGATFTAEPEVFAQAVGDNGFAPTGAAVHPATGDLYVAVGGRGTRGAVYRIRYPDGLKAAKEEAKRWQIPLRSLEWQPSLKESLATDAKADDPVKRRQALDLMFRHRAQIRGEGLLEAVHINAGHSDPAIRRAVANVVGTLSTRQALVAGLRAQTRLATITIGFGRLGKDPISPSDCANALATDSDAVRLAQTRLVQCALSDVVSPAFEGHVWAGYSPRMRIDPAEAKKTLPSLRAALPANYVNHTIVHRELARTLAMLEDDDPETVNKVAAHLSATSDPLDDIHYLIVLSRLRGKRTEAVTSQTATSLLALDAKIVRHKLNRDTLWPLRMTELYRELTRKDEFLNPAILGHPEFGRPDHVLWTTSPGFDRKRAAALFIERSTRDRDFPWNARLVQLVGELPDEQALPVLRKLWDQAGLNDTILPILAARAHAEDRERFLNGLSSPQLATIRQCLGAIEKLPLQKDPGTALALVKAVRRLSGGKEEDRMRGQVVAYLGRLSDRSGLGDDRDKWSDWFRKTYPDHAKDLREADGIDVEMWSRRLAKVDWDRGDAERGRAVFVKNSCVACHSGSQALGPDLAGIAGRFSRADLFTAIIQPSKDVSNRYRTTLVVTSDDKVYQGIIIYEAVDSLILQTSATETVRIANKQITEKRTTDVSLMPAGLLDKATDAEMADLYAHLKSLKAR